MTASAHAAVDEGSEGRLQAPAPRPLSDACILFLVVLALVTLGVLLVYSASRTAHAEGVSQYFAKHVVFAPIGLAMFIVGALVPYRWLNRWWTAAALLAVSVGLLVLVLVVGQARGGARRWLPLPGGLNFQPSELAKFALVIFLAWFYSREAGRAREGRRGLRAWLAERAAPEPRAFWASFVPVMGTIGLVCGLIVKEDFGTAALVGTVAVLLCLIAGWRLWYPLLVLGPAAIGFYFAVLRVPFRLDRLKVWLDPWKYSEDAGWHICQSLMALGSGGLFGTGLGAGIQKLYIPENTTDFIFAVLCEEMGIVGGIMVIGLFGVFVWRGGRVVRYAPDRFGFLLASGILLTIALQAVLNIGVVTSALPAKGISLPFISYGGSGLVVMSFAAGLLASIAREGEKARLSGAGAKPRPLVYVRR